MTSTICGVTKPERVRQTLEWARFPIPDAAWEELKAAPYSTDDPEATRQNAIGLARRAVRSAGADAENPPVTFRESVERAGTDGVDDRRKRQSQQRQPKDA